MTNIRLQKCAARFSGLVFFLLASLVANAQTAELQYRVIDGKVYAYEQSNPAAMYLLPDATPDQVGLNRAGNSSNVDSSSGMVRSSPRSLPFNTAQGVLGLLGTPQPIADRPAASNNALPAITFRDPSSLPNTSKSRNEGLPRYPGKNYPLGY